MSAHVLRGTKHQIAQDLAQMPGDVREAIVFVEETAPLSSTAETNGSGDIFGEMRPYMVDVGNLDDSREAIYTPMEGE